MMSSVTDQDSPTRQTLALYPVERLLLMVACALAAIDMLLAWSKGITVRADFFYVSVPLAVLFIAVGQVYRRWRDSERIALTMHAIALIILFSIFCALFNVLLLPRPTTPIDAMLVQADALLGYSWQGLTTWIAGYPALNAVLRTVYLATLAQLFFALMFLGMVLDRRRLHAAALAMSIAAVVVVCTWAIFPSAGASAQWQLDPEIDRIVRPVVGSEYGAMLYRLYQDGVREVSSLQVIGLIGFPSFHTVMGLMSLIATWPYRVARYIVLTLNALLAPAILIHGGHNLVDMIAGVVIALAAWRLSLAIFDALERKNRVAVLR